MASEEASESIFLPTRVREKNQEQRRIPEDGRRRGRLGSPAAPGGTTGTEPL